MFGLLRNAAVIATIAYFSPVHDAAPDARLEALRQMPTEAIGKVLRFGPAMVVEATGSMDPASRDALAIKIARLALQPDQNANVTNRR
jgi:hypothetical protein